MMRFSDRNALADELWPQWVAAHPPQTKVWLAESEQSRSAFKAGAMMAAAQMSRKEDESA